MAPTPPRTAPSAMGLSATPLIAAPQTAPDTMRDASGPAFNRLGVKGSLSAINSVSARSVILFEALAERTEAKGEFRKRIHLSFTAQASSAGAVSARKPATAPIPKANTGVYERFTDSGNLSRSGAFPRYVRCLPCKSLPAAAVLIPTLPKD